MANNPIQLLTSTTPAAVPVLGNGPTDNNFAFNGADGKFFYYDGSATQEFVGGISAVVDDTTPELGGNLDTNGNEIITQASLDLILNPGGTGNVSVSSARVTNMNDPVDAQDAATKAYVDSVSVGLLDFKNSVRVATTANIDLGVAVDPGAIDGVTLADGDRILLKDQSAGQANGIYDAVTAADPTTWVRSADADNSPTVGEVTAGMFCFVEEGTDNADTGWVLATDNPINLDTTPLTFVKFSTQGAITGTADRITVTGQQVDIAASYVGQTSITTLGTVATGTWEGTVIGQEFGGTGADLSALSAGALIKNNAGGTAFEAAVEGTDYLSEVSLLGGQTF